MDLIAHILTGILISGLGFKREKALVVIVTASILPDIDYIYLLFGTDTFLHFHRGITHGLFSLIIVPILIGTLAKYRYEKSFLYYSFIGFLGYGFHLLMDLMQEFGIKIFSPLDFNSYSFDLSFIFDPYLIVILLISLFIRYLKQEKTLVITLITFMLMIGYFDGRYYLKNRAEELLRRSMNEYVYRVTPMPAEVFKWWFVSRSEDVLKTGIVDLFLKRVIVLDTYKYSESEPEILLSKDMGQVKNLLGFTKFPYVWVYKDGDKTIVKWKDLVYTCLPGERMTATIIYNKNGLVEESKFRF
ncbi:MAG: metal-dependent hydrolase [Nitrospirae bacterium]|nr:metal-dependent hydrolase [Nitrospirota bacterium]MBF0540013.1 metal-dependent hydrolase [Nitrospirota bacterium]